jgi:hypothetical protein
LQNEDYYSYINAQRLKYVFLYQKLKVGLFYFVGQQQKYSRNLCFATFIIFLGKKKFNYLSVEFVKLFKMISLESDPPTPDASAE